MNKLIRLFFLLPAISGIGAIAPDTIGNDKIEVDRAATTVILDKISVKNLQIETTPVEEVDFETTVFAIGRIEESPHGRSVVASRVPGRIIELNVCHGDFVNKGDVIATIESRVYGNPPPKIALKALESGIVTDTHAYLGQPVEPEHELFVLSDRKTLWAMAKIPEVEAGEVKIGSPARIRIPALGDDVIQSKLLRFGTKADRDSGAVIGIFELQNPEGKIQPGMRAEFSIITRTRDWVMAVPVKSVQGDPTKRLVFVKDFELPYSYVRAPVVLGEKNDKYVEIKNGLFPGDEVVTRGSYALSFAGSGSGLSLKEALDLAHGHEHNEDGSEMTPEQRAVREREKAIERGELPAGGAGSQYIIPLMTWAVAATLLCLVLAQMLIAARREQRN